MRRAIELALLGGAHVHPNPLVGAVVVRDGKIVAEGYHHRYGDLHAERDCLKNAALDGVDLTGAQMYVTLEPCCHTGKQPPCTQAVIESGIKTVVVGSRDPNELVDGKGVKQLEEAGITVIQDFLRSECDSINSIFFHYIRTKRPYVILKYAMTADGKTSLSTGESQWITGPLARENVHRTRGTAAAIMCGIRTVLADDPMLNCRVEGSLYKNPVRVILDSHLQLPLDYKIVKTADQIPTMVFCSTTVERESGENSKSLLLRNHGLEVIGVDEKDGHLDLEKILEILGERKIDSLFVESGGALNSSFFFGGTNKSRCLVNEVHCYMAPKIVGGINGSVHSPVQGFECVHLSDCVEFEEVEVEKFSNDLLIKYRGLKVKQCSPES